MKYEDSFVEKLIWALFGEERIITTPAMIFALTACIGMCYLFVHFVVKYW